MAVEVALGVILMASAGLLARSFRALTEVRPGYKIENVLTLRLGLAPARYGDMNVCRRFFEEVIDKVQSLPGVEAAGGHDFPAARFLQKHRGHMARYAARRKPGHDDQAGQSRGFSWIFSRHGRTADRRAILSNRLTDRIRRR